MRPNGTIDTHAGSLRVKRPADTAEQWWSSVRQQLRNVATLADAVSIHVPGARAAVLRDQLRRGPAAAAEWVWSGPALRTERFDQNVAERVERVTSTPREQQASWPSGLDLAELGFTRRLRPSQAVAVARLLFANGGANFSVPGSGKTTVTYAVYAALKAAGQVHGMLVVSPQSAFEAWLTEAEECFAASAAPQVRIRPGYIAASDEVVVLNYERLDDPRVLTNIRRWSGNRRVMIVFDEAHRAKAGRLSRRGAASLQLASELDFAMVLTGTPMPNHESDLAAVFDLAWPGHGDRFISSGDLAHRRGRAYVRVTKADLSMPPMRLAVEQVTLTSEHRRLYDAMASKTAEWVAGPEATAAEAGKALLRLIAAATNPAAVFSPDVPWSLPLDGADEAGPLRELLQRPTETIRPAKIIRAAQLVEANRIAGRKTLLWSISVANVRALASALRSHRAAVIVGATPLDDLSAQTDRQRELARFRTDDDCWALVATPQTLGEGVSLHQVCTDQVHVDRGYAAGTWLQAIDRTHRLGTPDDVVATCTVLEATDTIDQRVSDVLSRKVSAMAAALDDPELRAISEPTAGTPGDLSGLLGDVDALRELLDHLG